VVVFTVTHFMPTLMRKFGLRNLLAAGSVFVAVSLIGFALLDQSSGYASHILLPLLIHSVGIALVFTPGSIIIMDGVQDEEAGVTSGVLQMSQQIGGAVGIAAIVTIYTANLKPGLFHSGLGHAFIAAAIIAIVAAVIALSSIPLK